MNNQCFYLTVGGSHAYGTNLLSSDVDTRGIYIQPKNELLGLAGIHRPVDKVNNTDCTLYSLQHFCSLACACNPNVIEILFTDENDILKANASAYKLRNIGNSFISKQCYNSFSGYARSQVNKISQRFEWITSPPTKEPQREDYGISKTTLGEKVRQEVEEAIRKKLETWNIEWELLSLEESLKLRNQVIQFMTDVGLYSGQYFERGRDIIRHDLAAVSIGIDPSIIEVLQRERKYAEDKNRWKQYNEWKALHTSRDYQDELRVGYSTKNSMHAVRLLKMGREILMEGKVIVKRPDREELLQIRRGEWPIERILEFVDTTMKELDDYVISGKCTLPNSPDHKLVDKICVEITEREWNES